MSRTKRNKAYSAIWYSPGIGKWCKQRLNKARRKAAKQRIRGKKTKDPVYLESMVNWRNN